MCVCVCGKLTSLQTNISQITIVISGQNMGIWKVKTSRPVLKRTHPISKGSYWPGKFPVLRALHRRQWHNIGNSNRVPFTVLAGKRESCASQDGISERREWDPKRDKGLKTSMFKYCPSCWLTSETCICGVGWKQYKLGFDIQQGKWRLEMLSTQAKQRFPFESNQVNFLLKQKHQPSSED